MFDQILFKSPITDESLDFVEGYKEPVMFMPIVKTPADAERALKRKINVVALELIFDTDDSPLLAPDLMRAWREAGLSLWVNAIRISNTFIIASDHHDHKALMGDKQHGWGWHVDRGFNIIQTDWPSALKNYLREEKLL